MGMKSEEVLEIGYDEFPTYLHANHSVYMQYGEDLYYLTDAMTFTGALRTPRSSTKRITTWTAASSSRCFPSS